MVNWNKRIPLFRNISNMKEGNTMKNMKKLTVLVALLLAMVLVLSACGSDDDSGSSKKSGSTGILGSSGIVGTWKLTDVKMKDAPEEELKAAKQMIKSGVITMEFTFTSDNKFSAKGYFSGSSDSGGDVTGTYKYENGKLTVTRDNDGGSSDAIEVKISGNTMELIQSSDTSLVFTRK